jgi:hypothetical protein
MTAAICLGTDRPDLKVALGYPIEDGSIGGPSRTLDSLVELTEGGGLTLTAHGRSRQDEDAASPPSRPLSIDRYGRRPTPFGRVSSPFATRSHRICGHLADAHGPHGEMRPRWGPGNSRSARVYLRSRHHVQSGLAQQRPKIRSIRYGAPLISTTA